jgi:hypothetical protein
MQTERHMDDIHDRTKEKYQQDEEPDIDGVLPVILIPLQICPEDKPHEGQSPKNEINECTYITPPEVQRRIKGKVLAESISEQMVQLEGIIEEEKGEQQDPGKVLLGSGAQDYIAEQDHDPGIFQVLVKLRITPVPCQTEKGTFHIMG